MQLFKRKLNNKAKNPNRSKIGKDPATDWFIVLCIFSLLIVTSIAFTGYRFYNVNKFIKELSLTTGVSADGGNKTREEELQDIIQFYKEKEDKHNLLLGKSKIEVKQDLEAALLEAKNAAIASSSAESGSSASQKQSTQAPASAQNQTVLPKPASTPAPKSSPTPKPDTESEELQLIIPSN